MIWVDQEGGASGLGGREEIVTFLGDASVDCSAIGWDLLRRRESRAEEDNELVEDRGMDENALGREAYLAVV